MALKKTAGRSAPDWLLGRGEEALKRMYAIAEDPETKPELRVQVYKFIVELELGCAGAPETAKPLSLRERREKLLEAARLLEPMGEEGKEG